LAGHVAKKTFASKRISFCSFFLLYFVRDASGKNSVIKNEKSLALDMCFCNGGGCLAVGLFGWG